MIHQQNIFGKDMVQTAIERLISFEPADGYYLAFSGGKDSVVVKALCDMANVNYEAHYRVTSVDPPELVAFIKQHHKDVLMDVPRYDDGSPITMWNLIPKKGLPPTRIARYCCEKLKESGGDGKFTVTGVRWAESTNRKANQGVVTLMKKTKNIKALSGVAGFKTTARGGVVLVNDNEDNRRMVEQCVSRGKVVLNPIIDWDDSDVWEYIHEYKIPYCKLYDEGFARLGCIGCPMAGTKTRDAEFKRWPTYKRAYIRAFDKMMQSKQGKELKTKWKTAEDCFNWWMEYDKK